MLIQSYYNRNVFTSAFVGQRFRTAQTEHLLRFAEFSFLTSEIYLFLPSPPLCFTGEFNTSTAWTVLQKPDLTGVSQQIHSSFGIFNVSSPLMSQLYQGSKKPWVCKLKVNIGVLFGWNAIAVTLMDRWAFSFRIIFDNRYIEIEINRWFRSFFFNSYNRQFLFGFRTYNISSTTIGYQSGTRDVNSILALLV